jgi:hypothetical protein
VQGFSGRAGDGVENRIAFRRLRSGVLVFLATCDGQFERFKWAAIELLGFVASLVGPDHGVVTVLLVTFDGVGMVPFNSHGVPSHGSENQRHSSFLRFRSLFGLLFSQRKDPLPVGVRLHNPSESLPTIIAFLPQCLGSSQGRVRQVLAFPRHSVVDQDPCSLTILCMAVPIHHMVACSAFVGEVFPGESGLVRGPPYYARLEPDRLPKTNDNQHILLAKSGLVQCQSLYMKATIQILLLLALLTATGLADDAAIKKQLVGKWKYNGQLIVLNADGSMNNDFKTWDVQDGKYIETKKSGATDPCTILKLTKTTFTFREDFRSRATGTWTRVSDQ